MDDVPADAVFALTSELQPGEYRIREDGVVLVGEGTDLHVFKFHLKLSKRDVRFLESLHIGIGS